MSTASPTVVFRGADRARHSTPIRAQPVQLGRIRSHYHGLSFHRQTLGANSTTGIVRTLCFRVQHLSQACDRRKSVGPSDCSVELGRASSDIGRDAVSRTRSDMAGTGQRGTGVDRVVVRLVTKGI